MAIVLENSFIDGQFVMFNSVVLDFTPTVGNKLLMSICSGEGQGVLQLIQTGVIWQLLQTNSTGTTGSAGTTLEHWMGDVVSTPATTITAFAASAANRVFGIHEISGLREFWPVAPQASVDGTTSPSDTGLAGLPPDPDAYFFGSLGGSDATVGTIPGAPSNGFITQEEAVGPSSPATTGHRLTTFDKTVSTQEQARSQLIYAGFTRWVSAVNTFRGDIPKPITRRLNTQVKGSFSLNTTVVNLSTIPLINNALLLGATLGDSRVINTITQDGVTWTQDEDNSNGAIRAEAWRGVVISETPSLVMTIDHGAGGSMQGGFIVEEYSGISTVNPVDTTGTNTAAGTLVESGLTTLPVSEKDELLFSVLTHSGSGTFGNGANGFLQTGAESYAGGIVGAIYANNETFPTLQYEVSTTIKLGTGFSVGIIVAYKNAVANTIEGPALDCYDDERNQSGTTDPVSSTSYATFASVGPNQFVEGNRHLILASSHFSSASGRVQYKIDISGGASDESIYKITGGWSVARLATLTNANTVSVQARKVDGSDITLRQVNLLIIDLDSTNFFSNRDWFHVEDNTNIADMDTTFANNVGATLRLPVDGTSDYLVIGHARMESTITTLEAAENVMRLRDTTNAVTLAQGGWHVEAFGEDEAHAINVMGVLEAPLAGTLDLAIEMIGGGPGAPTNEAWGHLDSSITVIRLDQIFSAGFKAETPNATPGSLMPPTAGHIDPQAIFAYEPDTLQEIMTLAYTEADNVANAAEGIATQGRFPGAVRSLWDTEDTTLGNNVVAAETIIGNYDTNNTDTRIPTFGVSRRTAIPPVPGTAEMFNGAIAASAPLVKKTLLVCLGKATSNPPIQPPPPDPVPTPTATTVLTEKFPPEHEEEALANQLEQFKPGGSG